MSRATSSDALYMFNHRTMTVIQTCIPAIERQFTLATMVRRIARNTDLTMDITTVDITSVVAVTNLLLRFRPQSP